MSKTHPTQCSIKSHLISDFIAKTYKIFYGLVKFYIHYTLNYSKGYIEVKINEFLGMTIPTKNTFKEYRI